MLGETAMDVIPFQECHVAGARVSPAQKQHHNPYRRSRLRTGALAEWRQLALDGSEGRVWMLSVGLELLCRLSIFRTAGHTGSPRI